MTFPDASDKMNKVEDEKNLSRSEAGSLADSPEDDVFENPGDGVDSVYEQKSHLSESFKAFVLTNHLIHICTLSQPVPSA